MAFSAIITLTRCCHSPIPLSHLQISRFHRAPIFPQYFHCRRRASTIIMSSASETAGTAAEETKLNAPYGSWKSPITADIVSGSDKRLGGFAVDSLGRLYWLESRPTESGWVSYAVAVGAYTLGCNICSPHDVDCLYISSAFVQFSF